MKKSELAAGTIYACSENTSTAYPARLLDLRLWRKSARYLSSNPAAWRDVTGEPGVRPGRSSGYTAASMTGYLVLRCRNWMDDITAEQLAAVAVPELPEDSEKAIKVIAGLRLPERIEVSLLITKHLLKPWEEYAREKAVRDAEAAEASAARRRMKDESSAAWAAANDRLKALGISATRLCMDKDWAAHEPKAVLILSELTNLLDLAEKANRSR